MLISTSLYNNIYVGICFQKKKVTKMKDTEGKIATMYDKNIRVSIGPVNARQTRAKDRHLVCNFLSSNLPLPQEYERQICLNLKPIPVIPNKSSYVVLK